MSDNGKLEDFQQRLTEYLEAVTKQEVSIVVLKPLAGGASRDTWQVTAKVGDTERSVVLRRDLETQITHRALERDQEFKVMKAARDAHVKVPCPRWYCLETQILGESFLIMDFVEGVSIGRQVVQQPELADVRKVLPEQMGEQLARIHAIDPTQHPLDFLSRPRPGFSPAQEALAQIREMIVQIKVCNPVLEFGLRWLGKNLPETNQTVVQHGDFRVGNFLVDKAGLNGIIDWEFARIGDPHDDLAWPCLRDWRYGKGELPLGGIGEREPFLQAYEKESGRTVNRKTLIFWEILGNLRWAVACLAQANRHLSGGNPNVELASLGRRSAEMQLEMLQLISEQGVGTHV
jgi:aminoglycoside phosphotransferase (APT) family kinase protein